MRDVEKQAGQRLQEVVEGKLREKKHGDVGSTRYNAWTAKSCFGSEIGRSRQSPSENPREDRKESTRPKGKSKD